jgi:hypothetical protein
LLDSNARCTRSRGDALQEWSRMHVAEQTAQLVG